MNAVDQIIGHLASWPYVLALVAILYRRPIGDVILRIRRVKCGDYFEGDFDSAVERTPPSSEITGTDS